MEKSTTQTPAEKQILSEADIEIRKNVNDLVRWLDGSMKFFVRSIKGLAELSQNREMFRSYVTNQVMKNLDRLSEIADIYDVEDEQKPEKEHLADDTLPPEVKKFFLNAEKIDYNDLIRFYNSEIVAILATNVDTLDSMRLRAATLHFVSKSGNEFGRGMIDYICNRILMAQTQHLSTKIAMLLCLMTTVRDYDMKEYGDYADIIKDITDDMTFAVCMAVTKDYENTQKPPVKDNSHGNKESGK